MKPKFENGQIVRIKDEDHGETAHMRISSTQFSGGAIRYYGTHFFGDTVGYYESELLPATAADLEMWAET